MFEETFYLAHHREDFPDTVDLFLGEFDTLAQLHNKATFVEFAKAAGVAVPDTITAHNQEELRGAITQFDAYIARPAFSRAGLFLFTNTGPRAGDFPIEMCQPSEENPWLVQRFAEGRSLCSFSVAEAGHVSYAIPRTVMDAAGAQFLSIDDHRIVDGAARLIEEAGITGCVSFDWIDTQDGLVTIECNPRATDGALLVPADVLGSLLTGDHHGDPHVVDAGNKVQLDVLLIRQMLEHRAPVPRTLKDLLTVKDGEFKMTDALPLLYQCLQHHRFETLALREQHDLLDEMMGDWVWNGEPIG
jgi:ATP-grasp domain